MGRRLAQVTAIQILGLSLGQGAAAQTQVQLSCSGTVLQSSGSAERQRAIKSLDVALNLQAEGPTAEVALTELQRRLASVRTRLRTLQVEQLQVGSPTTWQRPAQRNRPAAVVANLSVAGRLQPQRLQAMVREVGTLPGVRLSPVGPRVDEQLDRRVRRELLHHAYQDALEQAQDAAEALGLRQLHPLDLQVEGHGRPMLMRAMAPSDSSIPPFDPDELAKPIDRLQLQVRFCAS